MSSQAPGMNTQASGVAVACLLQGWFFPRRVFASSGLRKTTDKDLESSSPTYPFLCAKKGFVFLQGARDFRVIEQPPSLFTSLCFYQEVKALTALCLSSSHQVSAFLSSTSASLCLSVFLPSVHTLKLSGWLCLSRAPLSIWDAQGRCLIVPTSCGFCLCSKAGSF